MSQVVQHIEESLKNAYSYREYQTLVAALLSEGKSTTAGADEAFVHYSKLGLQRMQRWDKRFRLNDEQEKAVRSVAHRQIWIVIAEGWCGDAGHSLPVIHKLAATNSQIELKIVLREQNPALMNDFLTNGGKSIPKLIIFNPDTRTVEADWGPRPAPAQAIFLEAKKNQVDFETYEEELQKWYNADKGQTATREILGLIQ